MSHGYYKDEEPGQGEEYGRGEELGRGGEDRPGRGGKDRPGRGGLFSEIGAEVGTHAFAKAET